MRDITESSRGASFYGIGAGNPPQTKEIVEGKIYSSDHKKDDTYYPAINGEDISPYLTKLKGEYISWGKWLFRSRESKFFFEPHILIQRFRKGMERQIIATYQKERIINNDGLSNFISKDKNYNLKYLLPLLNSKLIDFWFQQYYMDTNVRPTDLNKIHIKTISPEEQEPFIEKADLMLDLNKDFYEKKEKFLKLLKQEYGLEKLSTKLNKFYELDFDEFMDQLKVKLSMDKKSELLDFFEKTKKEVSEISDNIKKTEKEINEMVYKLYGITDEEKKIVESSL